MAADSNSGGDFSCCWYANNNLYKFTDPDGRCVESALGVAFIVADGVDIAQNGLSLTNGLSMAANIVGLAVPFGTGFGPAVRGISAGVDAPKSEIKACDRVSGVAMGVGREAGRAALRSAGVPTSRSRADVKQPGGMPVPKAQRQKMTTANNDNPVVVSRYGPHPKGAQSHDKHPHRHAATPKIEQ